MSAPHLRAARPADAPVLGAILTEFVAATPWLPRLYDAAQDRDHAALMIARGWVVVAETAAGPRGFLARDRSRIHALYLDGQARRRGLGRALLRGAKRARPRLELWTPAANLPARHFYEREGFRPLPGAPHGLSDEGLPELRYVWTSETRP